ncbi:hypothetical protein AB0L13_16665 [Saccharopolyspora shandongensis]|uniref:hypothetical protein n=1 Tax=Saccharopolyspora shandongensis TaxID=418495 RepID=UPI0034311A89
MSGVDAMTRPPIVHYRDGRTLVDRKTLARLLGRSVHTIRKRCPVVDRDDQSGRPLHDAQQCAAILGQVQTRQRRTGVELQTAAGCA